MGKDNWIVEIHNRDGATIEYSRRRTEAAAEELAEERRWDDRIHNASGIAVTVREASPVDALDIALARLEGRLADTKRWAEAGWAAS